MPLWQVRLCHKNTRMLLLLYLVHGVVSATPTDSLQAALSSANPALWDVTCADGTRFSGALPPAGVLLPVAAGSDCRVVLSFRAAGGLALGVSGPAASREETPQWGSPHPPVRLSHLTLNTGAHNEEPADDTAGKDPQTLRRQGKPALIRPPSPPELVRTSTRRRQSVVVAPMDGSLLVESVEELRTRLDAGTPVDLTLPPRTLALNGSGELVVLGNVTLRGSENATVLDAGRLSRVLNVPAT
eukprot:4643737-Prymnesium_polylepis.1